MTEIYQREEGQKKAKHMHHTNEVTGSKPAVGLLCCVCNQLCWGELIAQGYIAWHTFE